MFNKCKPAGAGRIFAIFAAVMLSVFPGESLTGAVPGKSTSGSSGVATSLHGPRPVRDNPAVRPVRASSPSGSSGVATSLHGPRPVRNNPAVRPVRALSPSGSSDGDFRVNGSIFYPKYIAEGTVYTRGVADMPLAENSAQIAEYMSKMPSKYNDRGVKTSLNATFFNLPVYLVDSRDPETPRVRVNVPEFRNHMVTESMREVLFSDDIPIPDWAKAANPQRAGDSAMAIYDIGTGIIREYFFILKNDDGSWTASYGGYSHDMFDLAKKNYACQHKEGSDFVTGMIGAPGQIGIEEARRGEIRHAVCFTMANARKGVVCWPAVQSDGTDDNPNAPAQGQWFRLPPDLNIKKLKLKPMTELIALAVQKYGGFGCDKNLFCHAFNAEPGFVELHLKGQDPWEKGGDLYKKYRLSDNLLNDFPWELTEWAPVDWGKP